MCQLLLRRKMNRVFTHYRCIGNILHRECSTISQNPKWDLVSAVSLERKPIITRELNQLEKQVSELLNRIELERSYKSNFEMRQEEDLKRIQNQKKDKMTEAELEQVGQQTAQDFLDICTEELNKFKTADRVTQEENKKSLRRALDRNLLLLVEEKLGDKKVWMLPQGLHREGETLRQTAERILKEKFAKGVTAKFFGNAPCGFYKYKYPKLMRSNSGKEGAKVFFFKAQLVNGDVNLSKDSSYLDYHWATRNELDILQDEYLKSIQMFLIDEEH